MLPSVVGNSKSPNIINLFTGIFQGQVGQPTGAPWTLRDLDDFPFSEWSTMQEYYKTFDDWYEGLPLEEKITDSDGNSVDKYPVRINPIPNTCEKHAAVLLGNTLESIRNSGLPVDFLADAGTAEEVSSKVRDVIVNSFKKTGSGALFVQNAIISQFMGGCVFRVKWNAEDEDNHVTVESVLPEEFFGIPKGGNMWELSCAWFVRKIDIVQARKMGYEGFFYDNEFYYVDYWDEDKHITRINDKEIVNEENPFGVVPFVYIPHLRVKNFIGRSIVNKSVQGIIREWNLRFADVGDAVSDDSHSLLVLRGVRGNIKPVTLPDGRKAIDLGSAMGFGGSSDTQPELESVKSQVTSQPMINFNTLLENRYREEVKHPAIADGKDEGSQRSAATLVARMWPLISHIELERINWTTGLNVLAKMILTFCSKKNVYGITKEEAKMDFTIKWSSPLPKDREALISELVMRKKNGMTSLPHILALLGDIDDIEREVQLISDEKDAEVERAMKAKGNTDEDSPMNKKGNKDGKNNQEPGDRTNLDAGNTDNKDSDKKDTSK